MVYPICQFMEITVLTFKNGESCIFTYLTGSIINCND